MKLRIGKWNLENEVDVKVICTGYEISAGAVEKHNIKPSSIHTAEGRPVRADWGMHGSIIVEHAYV